VFNGDDFVFVVLDLIDGRIERGGLARASRARDENHAVGLADVAAELRHFLLVESDDIEREIAEFFAERFLVEDAKNSVLPMDRGHDGDTEVNKTTLVSHTETAVLRDATFGDIEF